MKQMTTRIPETLLERVRHSAKERNQSINEFVTWTLDAATNPDLAGSEAEQLRARLAAAGLLEIRTAEPRTRPPEAKVAAARRAAGHGTLLSDIVSADRGER